MSEQNLINARIAKAPTVDGKIVFPIASKAISVAKARELENDKECTVHGRVIFFRRSGSISFMKLRDMTGEIQLMLTKNVTEDYASIKMFDMGDIIEASGVRTVSSTGEVSVLVSKIKMLTKSFRSLPEKWAGLSDIEIRYRQRYLDLISNKTSMNVFKTRSCILNAIRSILRSCSFMEVETSTLNTISSGANAKPFTTHHNSLEKDLFLRIAPELYLKRLIVGGMDRVFEIGRCYRNEGVSTRHNPEFTMLEFYWAYENFDNLVSFTSDFIISIDNFFHKEMTGFYDEVIVDRPFSFLEGFEIVPMVKAVALAAQKASVEISKDFGELSESEWVNSKSEITRKEKINWTSLTVSLEGASSIGERVLIWFEHIAEPFLTEDYRTTDGKYSKPVFITEYPVEICPLARQSDKNPAVCDRFELFIEGKELCNAFQELNDPMEQARRFKEQLETNKKDPMDFDTDYVCALEHGMPPTVGFGMGIDRLVMFLTNSSSIKDVILFPTMR